MKITRKLFALTLALLLALSSLALGVAAEASEDGAVTAYDLGWLPRYRWDFDGDMTTSVGSLTAVASTATWYEAPTYQDGKIVLNGKQAFTLTEMAEDSTLPNRTDMRIDVKGKINWPTGDALAYLFTDSSESSAAKRASIVLGGESVEIHASNTGISSTITYGTFDKTADNLYTFIVTNKTDCYFYVNGVLCGMGTMKSTAKWRFEDIFGDAGAAEACGISGEIDYIQICKKEAVVAGLPMFDAAYGENRWHAVHQWDFDGNVNDSVGGVEATPVTQSYFTAPTYKDGKIVLAGTTAYTFATPLTFTGDAYSEYAAGVLRIDVKGSFNWGAVQGAHRIFGSHSGAKNMSGVYMYDMAGDTYKGCSWGLATDGDGQVIQVPKAEKFNADKGEHLYTFMYYGGFFMTYVDGELVTMIYNSQGGGWSFDDFLGCSYVGDGAKYGYIGEIDYIKISMLGDEIHTCTPSETYEKDDTHHWKVCTDTACGKEIEGSKEAHVTEGTCVCGKVVSTPSQGGDDNTGDDTTGDDNADTGITLMVLPVVLMAVTGTAISVRSKKRRD